MNGEKVKRIRTEKGYKLSEIAKMTGYTASFLSQIERNIKRPSLEALRKIADSLEVPIMSFLIDERDRHIVISEDMNEEYDKYCYIEKDRRKQVEIPEIGTWYQFITPIGSNEANRPQMVGFYIDIKPKCRVSEKLISHYSEESTFVIKGKVEVHVEDKKILLTAGDSFYIKGMVPHNYLNIGDEDAAVVSYLTPPVY